jgi:hypothetical protein
VHTGFRWGNPMGRDYLKLLGVNGTIILKFFFKKWNRDNRMYRSGSVRAREAGSGECCTGVLISP